MNKCIFLGKVINDLEVKYSATTQKAVVNFSIAVRRDFKNKDGKYENDFINCVSFGKQGELIGNSFAKGNRILVWGPMRQEKWQDKDGNNRTAYKLNIEGFDYVDSAVRDKSTAEGILSSESEALRSVDAVLKDAGEEVPFY